jgi:hypothetical protein
LYLILFEFRNKIDPKTKEEIPLLGEGYNDVLDKILDVDSFAGIALLLAGGMAISYLASSPILILHATRLGLRFGNLKNRKISLKNWGALLIVGVVALLAILLKILFDIAPSILVISIIVLLPFCFIIYLWVSDSSVEHKYRLDSICYDLVSKREGEKGYSQTYRHLREHGNAFFIVFTEALLGLCLFQAKKPEDIIYILCIWTIPPVFVWFFANYLEGHLISKDRLISEDSDDETFNIEDQ